MPSALELRRVSAGYGETVVIEDIDLKLGPGECISVIGRNGVGKTTLLSTIMGHTTLHSGEVMLDGARHRQRAELSPRARRHRLRAAGARDFSLAVGARKPRSGGAAGTMDACARLRAVPEAQGTARQHGQSALRRRAADAVDRARAADQSHPSCSWTSRPKAWRRCWSRH